MSNQIHKVAAKEVETLSRLTELPENDTTAVIVQSATSTVVAQRLLLDGGDGEGGEAEGPKQEVVTESMQLAVLLPIQALADTLEGLGDDAASQGLSLVSSVPKDNEAEKPFNMGGENNYTKALGPVSISIYAGGTKIKVANLSTPIKITMSSGNSRASMSDNLTCAYYDEETSMWSTAGVTTTRDATGGVACLTTHLTFFAAVELDVADIIANGVASAASKGLSNSLEGAKDTWSGVKDAAADVKDLLAEEINCNLFADLFTAESIERIQAGDWAGKEAAALMWVTIGLHVVLLVQAVRKDRHYNHEETPFPKDENLLTTDSRFKKKDFHEVLMDGLNSAIEFPRALRKHWQAGIVKVVVCEVAGEAIMRSAAVHLGVSKKSFVSLAHRWMKDRDPARKSMGSDFRRSHSVEFVKDMPNRVSEIMHRLESTVQQMPARVNLDELSRTMSSSGSFDMNATLEAVAPSAVAFVTLFIAMQPAWQGTCYCMASRSWTRMMARAVYFSGALACQALVFQKAGLAHDKAIDKADCLENQQNKTLWDKMVLVPPYALMAFAMSSGPAIILEALWQRKFVFIPMNLEPADFIKEKTALLRSLWRKDVVLSTVSFLYLALCWFIFVSFIANVSKLSLAYIFVSFAQSICGVFLMTPLVMATVLWLALMTLRIWDGGSLVPVVSKQVREKLKGGQPQDDLRSAADAEDAEEAAPPACEDDDGESECMTEQWTECKSCGDTCSDDVQPYEAGPETKISHVVCCPSCGAKFGSPVADVRQPPGPPDALLVPRPPPDVLVVQDLQDLHDVYPPNCILSMDVSSRPATTSTRSASIFLVAELEDL
eukprot:TRINITY_DN3868_c0_g1_i5.p2 TRINITY_DN3868_c0_g1~~TRINITY_DN3868_c0_g1_i5.p2  ORF type:complete len:833 (+),score=137.57 TRINITY_DN3868_c0_g1_i5:3100-5598(+)